MKKWGGPGALKPELKRVVYLQINCEKAGKRSSYTQADLWLQI